MIGRQVVADPAPGTPSIPALLYIALGPPVLWALHLAAIYFVVTLECVTFWTGAAWAIAAVTAAFALASLAAGWMGWRAWRRLGPATPDPHESDWPRFTLLVGMAGSALFTLVILLEALAPAFVATCP